MGLIKSYSRLIHLKILINYKLLLNNSFYLIIPKSHSIKGKQGKILSVNKLYIYCYTSYVYVIHIHIVYITYTIII